MLTKIHLIKIDIWSQISLNIPLKEYLKKQTKQNKGLIVSKRRRIKNVVKLQKFVQNRRNCSLSKFHEGLPFQNIQFQWWAMLSACQLFSAANSQPRRQAISVFFLENLPSILLILD